MNKAAPTHIVEELKRYDPDLRIRWSRQRGAWVIERYMENNTVISKPVRWHRDRAGAWKWRTLSEFDDKYIQYHERYVPIIYAHFLDRRLFWSLYQTDAWKQSYKGKDYSRQSEYADDKKKEKSDSKGRELLEETGKEALGFMRWQSGERMSLNGNNTSNHTH